MLHRQVQEAFAADWAAFHERGLYASLVADGLLVEHEPAGLDLAAVPGAVAVIRPRELPLISYPYEWCFSQLREAALLTLELQRRALAAGMRLKDASAFNVQFDRGSPILIDTLSFAAADPAEPWPAYRQFCEHFLGPLALIAYRDPRCGLLLRDFIDGVPLDYAARLLPGRTRLRPGLLAHLHLHAGAQRRSAAAGPTAEHKRPRRMTALGQEALLDSLRRAVEGLRWQPSGHWVQYGIQTSYTERGAASKREVVERLLATSSAKVVWDLGANVGTYSTVAAGEGRSVIAFDQDAASVERHWRTLSADARASVLPLVMDVANPSPALGWALEERRSLVDRGPADVILALALVHHLAIGNNVPLERVAAFFARLGRRAIVEFVPKEDPMTQHLLAARPDIFPGYTPDGFRAAFMRHFRILEEVPIEDSARSLFLLEAR
ncbi:MAG TPA: SAM-dependent methyltransferase [Candidatus Limnocylindria bacterium]|nr:SAM-dependent methyltransferase [Candidatus Limnocylindria bacterium]